MKPSERINLIADELRDLCHIDEPRFSGYLGDLCRRVAAILEYLDNEVQKPKYVCPNCHRIVDELITIAEINNVRPDGSIMLAPHCVLKEQGFPNKAAMRCKHCLNKN